MERLQPFVRRVPHPHIVHGQDLVERLRECRQLLGRIETEIHTPRTHGRRVASRRLPHHDGRVIDPAHETLRRPTAQLADRDPRSEADLKDVVGWLHPEEADGPHVALAVRRPQGHLPPDEPAHEPAGLPELGPDRQRQLLLPVHDFSQLPYKSLSPLAPP
jgi:hypothetical protein